MSLGIVQKYAFVLYFSKPELTCFPESGKQVNQREMSYLISIILFDCMK